VRDCAGGKPDFDYDYCKGCGICFRECPRAAIGLIEEEK
jgi:Pyruvate/2-oxoacid:ferredoxin oxidoreductase delta subunit